MTLTKRDLAREALEKSLEVREEVDCDFKSPVNVFDLCRKLEESVRVMFVDYSMEGCYHRCERPLMKLSSLRPLARRHFNCAHELGHHVFGHGSTIDELREEVTQFNGNSPNEFLVNAFAGYLLMPKLGVRRAATSRGWQITNLTPEQAFVVANHFGVGYATIVNHLAYGLREISALAAKKLIGIKLPKIRKNLVGIDTTKRLQVVDQHFESSTVDTEVGTHVLLPADACLESTALRTEADIPGGKLTVATKPGLCRVTADDGWAVVVRVSRCQYAGWSQFRHLGEEE